MNHWAAETCYSLSETKHDMNVFNCEWPPHTHSGHNDGVCARASLIQIMATSVTSCWLKKSFVTQQEHQFMYSLLRNWGEETLKESVTLISSTSRSFLLNNSEKLQAIRQNGLDAGEDMTSSSSLAKILFNHQGSTNAPKRSMQWQC